MSKSASNAKAKALKEENAVKKTKRKIAIIVCCCALVVIAAVLLGIFSGNWRNNSSAPQYTREIYSYGGQTIQLLADGTFTASLAHGARRNGTYTKTVNGNITAVSFNVNGSIEVGRIINNALHIPEEWNDGHGHGSVFPKVE